MTRKKWKRTRKACPLLKKNRPDCASTQISSSTAENALKYCVGNFVECPIYQAHGELYLSESGSFFVI